MRASVADLRKVGSVAFLNCNQSDKEGVGVDVGAVDGTDVEREEEGAIGLDRKQKGEWMKKGEKGRKEECNKIV